MFVQTIKTGFKKGIETTWMLSKILIPIYFFVIFLNHTPIIGWIAHIFEPFMGLFHLPGEAAIVLVLGNTLNLYAAIGAMNAISLTSSQITTLAIMLCFSHSLFVETAVIKKLGVKVWTMVSIRIGLALISGLLVGKVGAML